MSLLNKYIRTDDPTRFGCGRPQSEGRCGTDCDSVCGTSFGGEGLVVEEFTQDDDPWIMVDYGYAWNISPPTVITVWEDEATRKADNDDDLRGQL